MMNIELKLVSIVILITLTIISRFLADFGLAKLRDNDCSKMTSVVGTLYYACPEIIQHMPYNEKAGLTYSSFIFFLHSIVSFRYLAFRLCSLSYVNISSTI